MVEYHPISAKDLSRLHQFGAKVFPGIFLGSALYAGGVWKGDTMVADIEEIEEVDASELHTRRLNAKGMCANERWKIHIPSRLFLYVYVDDIKFGWKETKYWSDVESTQ